MNGPFQFSTDCDKILEFNKFAIYTILQRDEVALVDSSGKVVFRFGAQMKRDEIKSKLREHPEAIARIQLSGKFIPVPNLRLTPAQEVIEAQRAAAQKPTAKPAEPPPDDEPPPVPPAARAPLPSSPAPEPAAPTQEEIDRVAGGSAQAKPAQAADEAKQRGDDSTESTKPGVILICAADVEAEPIEWLWPDRFALGKIGMIAGEGAGGKSQITIDMAARITNGREWPNDEGIAPTGNAIFLSAEDDLKDTLVPRLMAAGADLGSVFFVDAVKDAPARGSQRRQFNVTKDVGRLCEAIDRMGNVRLVVIDPITAYLGSGKEVDSHRAADVRDALNPLKDYAEKLNFTAIIINHLNKGVSTSATSRVLGSGAFVHVARMVYLVAPDTEKNRSLFLPMKTNIGKRGTAGLAYRPETKFVSTDKHANIETSCIEWDTDEINKSADEALAAAAGRDGDKESDRGALGEAMNFLRDLLSEGPMAATEVQARTKEAGITKATLRRAKARLEVEAQHRGDGGTGGRGEWVWTMPKQITLGHSESGL